MSVITNKITNRPNLLLVHILLQESDPRTLTALAISLL